MAGGAALWLTAVVTAGGCSGTDSARAETARDELRRAVESTLASTSFVVHRLGEGEAAVDGETRVIFQAPDRARVSDSGGLDTIAVGRTIVSNVAVAGTTPGLFTRPSAPTLPNGFYAKWRASRSEGPYVDDLLEEIRELAAVTSVERSGSTYRWETKESLGTSFGEARIAGGRLVDFTVRNDHPAIKHLVRTLRFGDYDRAPAVDLPPADKVVDPPDLEPCDDDGSPPPGQQICGDGKVIEGFAGAAEFQGVADAAEIEGLADAPNPESPEPVDRAITDLLEDSSRQP